MRTTIVCFLIFLTSWSRAEVNVKVQIRPYTNVSSVDRVSLAHVAELEGVSSVIVDELNKIILSDSPSRGEKRIFSNNAIADATRKHGKQRLWQLIVPRKVVIENMGPSISEQAMRDELLTHWKALCAGCDLVIKDIQMPIIPQDLTDVPWTLEKEAKLPRGRFAHKILFSRPDRQAGIFWVSGQLEIRKKVPVARRVISINSRLTKEDFDFQFRDVTYATDSTPITEEEIIGQAARLSMNAESIIWSNSLLREKAVRRGDVVRATVDESGWQVTLQSVAEQDGFVGDTINLRNPQSRKLITGKVTGIGEVKIQ